MTNQVDTDELFGKDQDWNEILHLIRHDDFEAATNVVDELSFNEGWYNYSTLKFDLKGKRYSIGYKEHISDSVVDFEFTSGTFIELGDAEEMQESITKESLAGIENYYEKKIKYLEKYRDLLSGLNSLSKQELTAIGEMLISVEEELKEERKSIKVDAVGTLLIRFSKMRDY